VLDIFSHGLFARCSRLCGGKPQKQRNIAVGGNHLVARAIAGRDGRVLQSTCWSPSTFSEMKMIA